MYPSYSCLFILVVVIVLLLQDKKNKISAFFVLKRKKGIEMKKEHLEQFVGKDIYVYDMLGAYTRGVLTSLDEQTLQIEKGNTTTILNLEFVSKIVRIKNKNER